MKGLTSNANVSVVQTELDDVFFQEFDGTRFPGDVRVTDSMVFKQERATNRAVQQEVFQGVGFWNTKAEEQEVETDHARVANKKTTIMQTFAKQLPIPKEFFDDDMHNVVEESIRNFARLGRQTREETGWGIFRNAFTTTLTAAGDALISDSHSLIGGGTEDNKLTATLSPESLNDAIVRLREQVDQRGILMGQVPKVLLVPTQLFKLAVEITDSQQASGTADNDINFFSARFNLFVVNSPWIGDVISGGSDAAWFLIGDNHSIFRYERESMITQLMPWADQSNDNYIYKGRYREQYDVVDFGGIVGSDGTT